MANSGNARAPNRNFSYRLALAAAKAEDEGTFDRMLSYLSLSQQVDVLRRMVLETAPRIRALEASNEAILDQLAAANTLNITLAGEQGQQGQGPDQNQPQEAQAGGGAGGAGAAGG